jgi:hypothetical protein
MKRIYLILLVLIGISTSCTKNFEEFNTDTKKASAVPGGFLFANAQKAYADQESNTGVNVNEFMQWSQYWTATTYTDETNYDIVNRTVAGTVFRIYYRDILRDLKEAKTVIAAETAIGEDAIANQKNRLFIADMMEVLVYSQLVNIYGDVPYTEACDITNLYPKYDDGLTIYKDLISRLSTDVAGLVSSAGSFGGDDLYMGGDVDMWKKFGNTLKVRLGITLADVDGATAKAAVESAYADGFGDGENCQLVYEGGANSNFFYLDLVNSGRDDFVAANTLIDMLTSLGDPRIGKYFDNNVEPYLGGPYGESNPFPAYSHVAPAIIEASFPAVIADNTEVEFYLAEAAARGYSVGGTAEEHYNAGITASILRWGGTQAEVDTYLARPDVAYATAAGDWKQKIGTQAWLAFYTRGLIGFTSWRRLDYPILNAPSSLEGDYNGIPKRYTYPINEQTLNPDSYTAAATAIHGDKLTTPIFWDVAQPVPSK